MTALQIVWFKRDLRAVDHRPLVEAAQRGPVLPLLIVEPAFWREPDASERHYLFMRDTARELDAQLAALGQRLIVRVGEACDVLMELRRAHGIAALWSHEETGNAWTFARDRAVAQWARRHGIAWHERRQDGVTRRLRNRDGWASRWDAMMAEAVVQPPSALTPLINVASERMPAAHDLGLNPDGCSARQTGGREAGLTALESFLSDRGRDYRRAMSSPLAGAEACSRVSPYLAWGALSMREVTQLTWARMRELRGETSADARAYRASLTSFNGRLHWHCHFMQKLESAPSIETVELHPSTRGLRPEAADQTLLAGWADGMTGYPFLDACMRSLKATGWLNFRMRAMVMSFASYNLWQPWRETGLHLARQFTDYEPGIHWPQVQMQSGTTGINTIRIYNVVKQGHDQDPDGAFVRRWVPELVDVPDAFVHEPWTWTGADAIIGKRYPARIVELVASTKAAKDRIYSVRAGRAFHAAADAIQEKHGSRRSGMPMTGQSTRKRTVKAKPPGQMEFDL
jgi:deoxyribodipyrimidine photo-lyase